MKTMIATRTFNDAGTGRAFTVGEPIGDVDAKVLGNYEAAGLAAADVADDAPTSDDTAASATADAAASAPAKRKAATA